MKIIVTCGPAFEPIDGARRLTNMSTGRLGVTLSNFLTAAGHEVICFKGEGSSFPGAVRAARVIPFTTNSDLADGLKMLSRSEDIDAIYHAAALCDYRVEKALGETGEPIVSEKFSTRDGRLHLILVPAIKVLPKLRLWFPEAHLVGWKYELEGGREEAFAKAWNQLRACDTNQCVLNGAAYGNGFATCDRNGRVRECHDTNELFEVLASSLETRCSMAGKR